MTNSIIKAAALMSMLLWLTACSTPPSVIELSEKSRASSESLGKSHVDVIDEFSKYVSTDKERARRHYESFVKARRSELLAIVQSLEFRVKLQFEEAAYDLIANRYPIAIETIYDKPISMHVDKLDAEYRRLAAEASANPGDGLAKANQRQAGIEYYYVIAIAEQRKSAEFMPAMLAGIQKARIDVHAALATEIDSLTKEAYNFPGDSTAITGTMLAAYDTVLTSLDTYKKSATDAHRQQVDNLGTLHNYLTRPSGSSLLLAGLVNAVKATISGVFGTDSVVGQILNGKVDEFSDKANTKVDFFDSLIDNKMNDILERVSGQASTSGAETVNSEKPTT